MARDPPQDAHPEVPFRQRRTQYDNFWEAGYPERELRPSGKKRNQTLTKNFELSCEMALIFRAALCGSIALPSENWQNEQ
jgi:hypothetical protein